MTVYRTSMHIPNHRNRNTSYWLMVNLAVRPEQTCTESPFRSLNFEKRQKNLQYEQLINTKRNTLERWAHYVIIAETREKGKTAGGNSSWISYLGNLTLRLMNCLWTHVYEFKQFANMACCCIKTLKPGLGGLPMCSQLLFSGLTVVAANCGVTVHSSLTRHSLFSIITVWQNERTWFHKP